MKPRPIITLVLCLFLFYNAGIQGFSETDALEPPAKLTASIDRKSAAVGETIILTLKYFVPEGIKFESMPKIEGLDGFTIIDKKMTGGDIKLKILVDKLNKMEIGPVSLSYKDKDGIETIVRSEAVSLPVQSNLGDRPAEAQLKPIMDIIPVTPPWLKYMPWIISAGILAAALFWFLWWRKRRQRMEDAVNIKPPHVVAEEEIRKLQSLRIFEKGQHKEFYFRLSEIIRRYIEKIRNFPAVECTTEEIARRLKIETDRRILPLLRQADLVKFADTLPTQARKEDDVIAALIYIKDTSPVPVPAGQTSTVAGGAR